LLSMQEYRNRISISKRGSYRIMCLGESTTQGQYPSFLEEILNQRNIGIKFSVIDKGIGGTNTDIILSMLEPNLDAYHPDMVITMMGINDYGPHMPYEVISESKIINFLKSFRTYKLSGFLWLHIVTRLKDLNQPKLILQRTELESAYAKDNDAQPSEQSYKKAIELNPNSDQAYKALAEFYRQQGKPSEAGGLLKKAIELNPNSDQAYKALAEFYRQQGRLSEAGGLLKKAIELNPKNDWAYWVLGEFYRQQGRPSEAEGLLKKAIELNPKNEEAYIALGEFYRQQGRLSEAGGLLKKAIELNPKNDWAYWVLGQLYVQQRRLSEAEGSYKKAIELNPKNDKICGALEALYKEMGNPGLARECGKKAKELRLSYYDSMTINNYHKLKAILDKRGITYICMQYPMRNLELLKRIFHGNTEGIIFVDNEKLFKEALEKANYREYFADMFGGDFGHCTKKGNRLLAENIAKVILKEVFGK